MKKIKFKLINDKKNFNGTTSPAGTIFEQRKESDSEFISTQGKVYYMGREWEKSIKELVDSKQIELILEEEIKNG